MKSILVSVVAMFQVDNLISIAFFSFTFYLLLLAMNFGGVYLWVVGILAWIVLAFALQEYCRELIEKVSSFSKSSLMITAEHFNPFTGNRAFSAHVFLFFGLYKLVALLLGDIVGEAFIGCVFILLVPASYAILAMTNDAFASINPAVVIGFIQKIKFDYVGMFLVACLAYFVARKAVNNYDNPSLFYMVFTVFSLFVCARYIGEIAVLHKEELGLEDVEEERQQQALEKSKREFEYNLYQLVAANKVDAALGFIETQKAASDFFNDDEIHQLLVENEYKLLALRHADRYLGQLVAEQKLQKAWRMALFCTTHSERYFIDDMAILNKLVASAATPEQYRAAVLLLTRLADDPESSPGIKNDLTELAMSIAKAKIGDEKIIVQLSQRLVTDERQFQNRKPI